MTSPRVGPGDGQDVGPVQALTFGPGTGLPSSALTVPARRSCTERRRRSVVASLALFGRLARRGLCHGAVDARYARPPRRVAALRHRSRETVDGALRTRRAMSRTPAPCARRIAISSRSAQDRERADGGAKLIGGIPPPSRNQRPPTGGDTPQDTAASSLDSPRAIAFQNRCGSARPAPRGRPGERIAGRPARSDRLRFRFSIAAPHHQGVATTS